MEPVAEPVREPGDAVRIALALVRADWQGDREGWDQLWAVADDHTAVAAQLSRITRETLERLAAVAGISMGEMLHRMAASLIPHTDPAPTIKLVDLSHITRDRR